MRPRHAAGLLAAVLLTALLPSAAPASAAVAPRRIALQRWDTTAELAQGTLSRVTVTSGAVRLGPSPQRAGRLELGRWASPWVTTGFDLTELVASWQARTPGASRLLVQVRGRTSAGALSSWDTLARWALRDGHVRRTTYGAQSDDLGRVAYDTWLADGGLAAWQLRVTLQRPIGSRAVPSLDAVGAMASRLPAVSSVTTSTPGAAPAALGRVLDVPSYSQMVHQGEYPEYDGGGEAWCSPTSTAMVLGYYDALPPPSAYRWVDPTYPDRFVDHVARMTYDVNYGGTGTWPFNTAYAAARTGHAFVTRLRSLRDAERFIAAGIPLVASVTFGPGQLAGAPISSTGGHLLVIVGFTADGDVIVNDPAAATRAGVRRTYDRAQFEDAWLPRYPSGSSTRGSGGLVYVITDDAHPLPDRGAAAPW